MPGAQVRGLRRPPRRRVARARDRGEARRGARPHVALRRLREPPHLHQVPVHARQEVARDQEQAVEVDRRRRRDGRLPEDLEGGAGPQDAGPGARPGTRHPGVLRRRLRAPRPGQLLGVAARLLRRARPRQDRGARGGRAQAEALRGLRLPRAEARAGDLPDRQRHRCYC